MHPLGIRAPQPESLHQPFPFDRGGELRSGQVGDRIGIQGLRPQQFKFGSVAHLSHALHDVAACLDRCGNVLVVALRLPRGYGLDPGPPRGKQECYDFIGRLQAWTAIVGGEVSGERRNADPGHCVDRKRSLDPGLHRARRLAIVEGRIDRIRQQQAVEARHAEGLERAFHRGVLQYRNLRGDLGAQGFCKQFVDTLCSALEQGLLLGRQGRRFGRQRLRLCREAAGIAHRGRSGRASAHRGCNAEGGRRPKSDDGRAQRRQRHRGIEAGEACAADACSE